MIGKIGRYYFTPTILNIRSLTSMILESKWVIKSPIGFWWEFFSMGEVTLDINW